MTCVRQKMHDKKVLLPPFGISCQKQGAHKKNNCHQLPPSQIFPRRNNKKEAFFLPPEFLFDRWCLGGTGIILEIDAVKIREIMTFLSLLLSVQPAGNSRHGKDFFLLLLFFFLQHHLTLRGQGMAPPGIQQGVGITVRISPQNQKILF